MERVGKFVGFALAVLLVLALADGLGIIDVRWFWERNAAPSALLPQITIDDLKAGVSTLQSKLIDTLSTLQSKLADTSSQLGSSVQITELSAGEFRKESDGTTYFAQRKSILSRPQRNYGLLIKYIDALPGKTTIRILIRQENKIITSCDAWVVKTASGSYDCVWRVLELDKGNYMLIVEIDKKQAAVVPISVFD